MIWVFGIVLALVLSACAPSPTPAPTQDVSLVQTQSAQTVVADLTQNAPVPTEIPPTFTPEPTPTLPPPTPTYSPVEGDPAIELGEPDGIDTFDSPANFGSLGNRCFQSQVTNGQFVMAALGQPDLYCWTTSWPTLQDFYIETTAIMPDACAPGDNFGLLVRSPDSVSGYLFGLNCAGEYSLLLMTGGSVTELIPPAGSEFIQSGSGQINRMGIGAYGGDFYLYANGNYLTKAADFTYVQPGDLGYYINASTSNPFVSHYEELKVWVLEDAYYPSSAPLPDAPPVEPVPPVTGEPYVTATTAVNVRSGPSTSYPIYGVAQPGASAPVSGISPDGGWYVITIPETYSPDGTAWVSADYATLTGATADELPIVQPPPPPPDVIPPTPEIGSIVVQTTEPVNVRAGPGNEFPSYGKVPIGTPLQAVGISQDGNWVAVIIPTSIAPSGIGWVNSAYLQPFDPASLPSLQP